MKITLIYKGGKGSGHHGHAGRPGKVGGSLPESGDTIHTDLRANLSDSDIQDYIYAFVRLHNAASKEYTTAFKKVGARMWHDDDAHPLKSENRDFMLKNALESYKTSKKLYKYSITHPLTVLDSYSNVTRAQRKELDKSVSEIYSKYSKLLDEEFNKLSR